MRNKKKDFLTFLIVVEDVVRVLCKKISEKLFKIPLVISKSSVSLFPTGAIFLRPTVQL